MNILLMHQVPIRKKGPCREKMRNITTIGMGTRHIRQQLNLGDHGGEVGAI